MRQFGAFEETITQAGRQSEEVKKVVRDIRRATRQQYSAEERVRIVIAGPRGKDSIAKPCRKKDINQNLYYRCSKEFLEAGKKRLAGNAVLATQPATRRSAAVILG